MLNQLKNTSEEKLSCACIANKTHRAKCGQMKLCWRIEQYPTVVNFVNKYEHQLSIRSYLHYGV